jgi:carbonic anhydrase/acetyltransferase-like protein (isoleucine patch superfamily)
MLLPHRGRTPVLEGPCFIAPGAHLIGDVRVAEDASIWFNAVLRADEAPISVGRGSNLQDGVMVHTDADVPVEVGENVTVGHGAILHGCVLEDGCLVGMGAIVLNGARIGRESLVAAGTLIPEGRVIPPESLVMGSPGRVVRSLRPEELERLKLSAPHYVSLWQESGWAL